ncbi:MAG: tRNA (guanosine(46)-N7)-methyltransferase TrmB, partial [archaeon]|nr:tRNA (guanosine(46)-N7)-methyltransferase TrmB [archaeon]
MGNDKSEEIIEIKDDSEENKDSMEVEQNKESDQEMEINENNSKNVPFPHKSNYRMRAHCNPFSLNSLPYPFSPECVDWSLHFPTYFEGENSKAKELFLNTPKFPIKYNNDKFIPMSTINSPIDLNNKPHINILDIGCGYGGLLFGMSQYLASIGNDLALGMEIRDKVTEFAGERLQALRKNSGFKEYLNISFLRTNTMKYLTNYFYKGQMDKIFFCFPDPHFKKKNHKRRIINKYLISDYYYLLKEGGILYTITDVEDLFLWEKKILSHCPCFKEIDINELEKDPCLEFMKNTDEAQKVQRKNGAMYYAAYRRIKPEVKSFGELYDLLIDDEE